MTRIRDHNSADNIKTIVLGILNDGWRPAMFCKDDEAAKSATGESDGNSSEDTASSSDSDSDMATQLEAVDEPAEDNTGEELCHAAVEDCGLHISTLLWALQAHPSTAATKQRREPRRGKRLPKRTSRRPAKKVLSQCCV